LYATQNQVLSRCKQLSEHSRDTKLKNIQHLVHIRYAFTSQQT